MRQIAVEYATQKHAGQFRKCGVVEYITHPIGVAGIVEAAGGDETQIIAALLHDVIEDCFPRTKEGRDAGFREIAEIFGQDIAHMVMDLTNTPKELQPDKNRAARKAIDNERLAQVCRRTKTVKLADILYNVNDMQGLEPGFRRRFLYEKREQAEVVADGHEGLYQKILAALDRQKERFGL